MFEFAMDLFNPPQNEVSNEHKTWHISYAETSSGDTDDETAIVNKDKFYILNGDHRKQYNKLNTLKECMAYYKKHKNQKSSWSN